MINRINPMKIINPACSTVCPFLFDISSQKKRFRRKTVTTRKSKQILSTGSARMQKGRKTKNIAQQ